MAYKNRGNGIEENPQLPVPTNLFWSLKKVTFMGHSQIERFFYSCPSSIVQTSNPLFTWIWQPDVEWGFVYFYFCALPGFTQRHPADQWPFLNIQSTATGPSSGGYFTDPFLLLMIWFLFFGVCLDRSSTLSPRFPIFLRLLRVLTKFLTKSFALRSRSLHLYS